jgi:hypothetical protein
VHGVEAGSGQILIRQGARRPHGCGVEARSEGLRRRRHSITQHDQRGLMRCHSGNVVGLGTRQHVNGSIPGMAGRAYQQLASPSETNR